MTPEDFRRLTETYGGESRHWPAHVRAEAQALLARDDPVAKAALARARHIDSYLASHELEAPDPDLIRRIVLSAPASSFWAWRGPRVWFSGAGLIGAGAAGVLAGALVISTLAQSSVPEFSDQNYAQTVFSGRIPDWSDE